MAKLHEEQEKAIAQIMMKKGQRLFLTGSAGTGKSTVVRELAERNRSVALTATTGIAAQLLNGFTLHSFCSFHPDLGVVPSRRADERMRYTDVLVVDEVSMMNETLLSWVYTRMRYAGHQPTLLLAGDFLQLPPVEGVPLFKTSSWDDFVVIRLQHNHRQVDAYFIDILNSVRRGKMTADVKEFMRARMRPNDNAIQLVSLRDSASALNRDRLRALDTEARAFNARCTMGNGESITARKLSPRARAILDKRARFNLKLEVKVGARIVMLNNDAERRWFNGSAGEVVDLNPGSVTVLLDDGNRFRIEPIEEEVRDPNLDKTWKIKQFPMMLAWALTIHKSQGMTLEQVNINLTRHFADGQTYVAMSRCRTPDGITFSGRLPDYIHCDTSAVREFS